MEKLKPYRVTKAGPVYRVNDIKKINRKLFESLEWPKDAPWLTIDFPPTAMTKGRIPKFGLPAAYNPIVNCYSVGKRIKLPAAAEAKSVSVRPAASIAENLRVYRAACGHYLKAWGKKLGPAFRRNAESYVDKYLPDNKALIVFKNGVPCGLYSYLPYKSDSKNICNHVTWHNLFPGLSLAEKSAAKYQAAVWLKKTSKRPISVSLDTFEKEYFDFFAGLGLRMFRLLVERR